MSIPILSTGLDAALPAPSVSRLRLVSDSVDDRVADVVKEKPLVSKPSYIETDRYAGWIKQGSHRTFLDRFSGKEGTVVTFRYVREGHRGAVFFTPCHSTYEVAKLSFMSLMPAALAVKSVIESYRLFNRSSYTRLEES